jgi:TetR/AcrR family transcriptional regulator
MPKTHNALRRCPPASRHIPSRRRSAPETKARILEAALNEFAVHGFSGARVDSIAARADVNKRMLYAYFGNKRALWLASLEHVYTAKRSEENRIDINHLSPDESMRALVRFNFCYHVAHPEFIALVNNENLMGARTLRQSSLVQKLYSPLLKALTDVLYRGQKTNVFRSGVDPMQLYISIAALGYFYCSNAHTLSAIFSKNLGSPSQMKSHENHVVDVIMGYLRPESP